MAEVPELEAVDVVAGRPDVTAWRRAARRHQAKWRTSHGWPAGEQRRSKKQGGGTRPSGSRVSDADGREHGVNFLTPAAWEAATFRLANPEQHQTLDETRLFCDLLSSMPMCFNLLGPLWADPALAAEIVHRWFPEHCPVGAQVTVAFEWSPGRRDPRWLGDRTAFDAKLEVRSPGRVCLIGVETKYHEHAAATPVVQVRKGVERVRRLNPRYLEVTSKAELFAEPDWLERVWGQDVEQIWRDHLLALACLQGSEELTEVCYVLVAPAGNPAWPAVAADYAALLSPVGRSSFRFVTLEDLLARSGDALPNAEEFRARYLDVSLDADTATAPTAS
jgi:hypothetical protein